MAEITLVVRGQLSFSSDQTDMNVLTRRREALSASDSVVNHLNAVRPELIGLQDTASEVTRYFRKAGDSITMADVVSLHLSIVRRETLRILDDTIAGPNARYGDLAVYHEGMTAAGLTDLSEYGPEGFGRFRPFRPGLYEFDELYFKTEMRSLDPSSLPRVDELYVQADVDDRTERGTGTVSSAPTGEATVIFNRPFFSVPEVVAVYKTAAVPCDVEVYAVTENGFKAKLKRRDTGAYITGTFTYAALGV